MTPYELRFEIFKQAYNFANDKFNVEYEIISSWNENSKNTVKSDYPEFPTYEEVEKLANKINNFVSSK
jgi:hypothetical protein